MAKIKGQLEDAQLDNQSADPTNLPDGLIWLNTATNRLKAYAQAAVRILVTEDQTQTLTNKTLVAANNTITTAASGGLAATELNAALAELDSDLTTHMADTSTHGVAEVVGRTEVQTLTNKTIDGDNNTVQDLPVTALKTAVGNADKVLTFDGSGIPQAAKVVVANINSAAATGGHVLTADGSGNATFQSVTPGNEPIVAKTANYTATNADGVIHCSASGGAFTITLPAAASNTGLDLVIKKTDSSTNGVTIDGNASETIDGALTQVLNFQYQTIKIVSDGTNWLVLDRYPIAVAILSDEKAANTAGGTFTSGSFVTRTLNTEVDPFGIVSLSANQFTLQPGTYKITASAPAYVVNRNKIKLRNVTDGSDAIIGSTEQCSGSSGVQINALVSGIVTITAAKAFELQHRCESTQATSGLGQAANMGVVEVYAMVEIEKLI